MEGVNSMTGKIWNMFECQKRGVYPSCLSSGNMETYYVKTITKDSVMTCN